MGNAKSQSESSFVLKGQDPPPAHFFDAEYYSASDGNLQVPGFPKVVAKPLLSIVYPSFSIPLLYVSGDMQFVYSYPPVTPPWPEDMFQFRASG